MSVFDVAALPHHAFSNYWLSGMKPVHT